MCSATRSALLPGLGRRGVLSAVRAVARLVGIVLVGEDGEGQGNVRGSNPQRVAASFGELSAEVFGDGVAAEA